MLKKYYLELSFKPNFISMKKTLILASLFLFSLSIYSQKKTAKETKTASNQLMSDQKIETLRKELLTEID